MNLQKKIKNKKRGLVLNACVKRFAYDWF